MINESIFYRYNSFEISNNPFLKYYKYIFPFKLQCQSGKKKLLLFHIQQWSLHTVTNGKEILPGSMESPEGEGCWRDSQMDWYTARAAGKKAKKTHDQVYIAFILFLFFLSNRIIKVILQSAFRAATAP